MKQEMMGGGQWHQLDYMQITCTSLQANNHASRQHLIANQQSTENPYM